MVHRFWNSIEYKSREFLLHIHWLAFFSASPFYCKKLMVISREALINSSKSRRKHFSTVSKLLEALANIEGDSSSVSKLRKALLNSLKTQRKLLTVSKVAENTSWQFQKLREALLNSFKIRRKYFSTVSKVVWRTYQQFKNREKHFFILSKVARNTSQKFQK